MKDRKNLTKSLHTVSAVVAVAMHLRDTRGDTNKPTDAYALSMVSSALDLLGQVGPWETSDPTVEQCVRVLLKRIAKGG